MSHSRLNLRGIPAAYRAAREPGDEAEGFSSSARHMGQPLSGSRGGNAANESKKMAMIVPTVTTTFLGRVKD